MSKKLVDTVASQPAYIHSLTNEGKGVAVVEGKTTFVENALPEETVKYRIYKKRRHYDEAATFELLQSSPDRSVPLCSHFGVCGGCSLQHLEISAQIKWKEKMLIEQLARLGQVEPEEILPPL